MQRKEIESKENNRNGCRRRVYNFFREHNIFDSNITGGVTFTAGAVINLREGGGYIGSLMMGLYWAFMCKMCAEIYKDHPQPNSSARRP